MTPGARWIAAGLVVVAPAAGWVIGSLIPDEEPEHRVVELVRPAVLPETRPLPTSTVAPTTTTAPPTTTVPPTTTTVIPLVLSSPDELAMGLDAVAVEVICRNAHPGDHEDFIDAVHAAETAFHDAVVAGEVAYTVDPPAMADAFLRERHPDDVGGCAFGGYADCFTDIAVSSPGEAECEGLGR